MRDLKERRGYGLGERNPKTQQYGVKGFETAYEDITRSAEWAEIRKLAASDRLPRKYFW